MSIRILLLIITALVASPASADLSRSKVKRLIDAAITARLPELQGKPGPQGPPGQAGSAAFAQTLYQANTPWTSHLVITSHDEDRAAWTPLALVRINEPVFSGDTFVATAHTQLSGTTANGYLFTYGITLSVQVPDGTYSTDDLYEFAKFFPENLGSTNVLAGDRVVSQSRAFMFTADQDYPDGVNLWSIGRARGDATGGALLVDRGYIQVYKVGSL